MLNETVALINNLKDNQIISGIIILVVGTLIIYLITLITKNIRYFLQKNRDKVINVYRSIKELLKSPFKIVDAERKHRLIAFHRSESSYYHNIYYKPPSYWDYQKMIISLLFTSFILIVILYLLREIYFLPLLIIPTITIWITYRKMNIQEENLKNEHFLNDGTPLEKKNGQFHFPENRIP